MKVLAKIEPQFIEGCIKVGSITRQQAEQVWQEWLAWAKYGFNKSHSACYALISYQTAYLKAHYPAEFMAALMTSDIHNLDRISIEISEAEKMGLKVLPPSVNDSFVEFGVSGEAGKEIRFGLAAIKNIGEAVAEHIVEERKNGKYANLEEFCTRVGAAVINKKTLESLAMCGALDELAERQQLLDNADMILKFVQSYEKEKNSQQVSLFGGMSEAAPQHHLQLAATTAATKQQRLAWEKELLSVYVSEHPLSEYKDKLGHLDPIRALDQVKVDGKVAIGGILTAVKAITTKKGDPMVFATLEDFTGSIEIVVFPKTLKENPALWTADAMLIVKGKVNDRDNQRTIIVDHAASLSETTVRNRPTQLKEILKVPPVELDVTGVTMIHLLIDGSVDRSKLNDVKTRLLQANGETPVACILQGDEPKTVDTKLKITLSKDLILDLHDKLGQDRVLLVR